MRRALALLIGFLSLASGCVGREPEAPPPAGATTEVDGETPPMPTDDPLYDPARPYAERGAPDVETVPLMLDGNVGSSATACVLGPVGQCRSVPVQDGNSGLILEGLTGWIDGGEVVLTWDAGSPATEELAAGFMLMDGGDGCEGIQLGGAHGASPLTIAISEAARPLCSGEVVHLWVSGNHYGFQDPAYYQADIDQEFHAEGSFLLREVAEA